MKLALIVPFRARYAHLRQFIPHYSRFVPNAKIFVIEQHDEKPFNRGGLINAGFLHFESQFDYFAAHDVDMLCTKGDYSYCETPTQLATHAQQFKYKMPFKEYFGGVTLFNNADFKRCNGFSNNFRGYGAEDEDLYNNVINSGLKIAYRDCWYHSLHHTRTIDPVLHTKNIELRNKGRGPDDGLTHCKYQVVAEEQFPEYVKLKVVL